MFVRPSMVALTVERIFSWVLMVGIRSHTFERARACELFSVQDIEDFRRVFVSLWLYWHPAFTCILGDQITSGDQCAHFEGLAPQLTRPFKWKYESVCVPTASCSRAKQKEEATTTPLQHAVWFLGIDQKRFYCGSQWKKAFTIRGLCWISLEGMWRHFYNVRCEQFQCVWSYL